ncbi:MULTISPECIES: MFS transporter [Bacillus]|uniref:MFS transporter n=1 Tax=Bacillus TaxID=1386 RepID=UPI0001A14537|nr:MULTISPECIES: MFS transporter [Bacillus]AIK39986.1 major Facilitator Superfamily protein [Bacillus pseudomycoides]AJI18360.1 major Facilitator Superfamily protein [Bacillus pseudomycoides]EEM17879.1 Permease [Bacillus pseudomycoides DSM 12442]MED1596328.1 MFS transporter [Bacillus pseudomycoides]MED4710123.1 MFS transporter [Bacillus pseudomycoides]
MGDVSISQNDPRIKIATRNIILMMIGKMTSLLGAGIYTFAMGLYVLKTTGSGVGFAITLICGSIPRMVCGPIAGAVADRINRRWVVIGADLLSSLIMFTMFALSTLFDISLLFIYVSAALLSICASFYSVSFTASIPTLVDSARIQQASSLNQTATALSTILAPVIGGMVFGLFSMKFFFLLNGITFFLAVIVQFFIAFDLYKVQAEQKKADFLSSIKEGFLYVKRRDDMYTMLKVFIWINFFGSALFVALPYIIIQNLRLSSQQLGVVEGMLAVGMLVASIVLSVRKEMNNLFRAVRISLFVLAGLYLCTAFPLLVTIPGTVSFIYYIIFMLIFGMTSISINVPLQVYVQKTTDSQYLGRVFGLIETISTAITPLGIILYGFLLDIMPTSMVMVISAIGVWMVVLLGMKQMDVKKQVDVSA